MYNQFPVMFKISLTLRFITFYFYFYYILSALLSSEYCLTLWANVNCWCYQRHSSTSIWITCHSRVTFDIWYKRNTI